jgi:hypothetical protein
MFHACNKARDFARSAYLRVLLNGEVRLKKN